MDDTDEADEECGAVAGWDRRAGGGMGFGNKQGRCAREEDEEEEESEKKNGR